MKNILKFVLLSIIGIIFFSMTVLAHSNSKYNYLIENQDTLIRTGKLLKEPMETKKGKSTYVNDYFFQTIDFKYFIKTRNNKALCDTLDKYIGENVLITYVIKNGNWDSTGFDIDNPKQSRIGQYIVIIKLNKED